MTLRQLRDLRDVPYTPLSVLRSQPSVELLVALGGVTTVDLVRNHRGRERHPTGVCARRQSFVRDANRQALAYVYVEEPG